MVNCFAKWHTYMHDLKYIANKWIQMAHTLSKMGRPKHIKRTNAGRFGMQLGCSKYLHIKCFRSGINGLASPRRLNAQAEQLTGNIFKIHLLQGEESLGSRSSIFAD